MAKMGRPTDYTKEIGQEICSQILEGNSLLKIVDAPGMPTYRTVMNWVLKHEDFFQSYSRAREQQTDALLDKGLAALDDAEGKDDTLAAARRVEVLIKLAEKQNPRKYGNRLELAGALDLNHKTDAQLESELAQLLGKASGDKLDEGDGAAE